MDQRKKALVYRLVGIRIMYYRTLRGWSQEELARRTGVSKSTISKIEQGKYGAGLSLAMILDIGEALEVGMDVLVVASNQDMPIINELLGKKTYYSCCKANPGPIKNK